MPLLVYKSFQGHIIGTPCWDPSYLPSGCRKPVSSGPDLILFLWINCKKGEGGLSIVDRKVVRPTPTVLLARLDFISYKTLSWDTQEWNILSVKATRRLELTKRQRAVISSRTFSNIHSCTRFLPSSLSLLKRRQSFYHLTWFSNQLKHQK